MKSATLFASPQRRLTAFVAGSAGAIAASLPLTAILTAPFGVSRTSIVMAVSSAIIAACVLALSIVMLRHENSTLKALGLPTYSVRTRDLGLGFIVSTALFLAVAGVQSAMVGASWSFQGTNGAAAALIGLPLVVCFVMAEELLFRGLALRYLRQLFGDRAAIVFSAVAFGVYHLVGSNDWAMGAFFRFLMPTLGGLLFGWAAVRSGGLALPIGLHLGGNWVQSSIAGFSAAGDASVVGQALWQIPSSASGMQYLTAPDLLQRLPYLVALAVASMITLWYVQVYVRQTSADTNRENTRTTRRHQI